MSVRIRQPTAAIFLQSKLASKTAPQSNLCTVLNNIVVLMEESTHLVAGGDDDADAPVLGTKNDALQ